MCCNAALVAVVFPTVPDATVPLVTGDVVEVAEVKNGFVDGVDLPVNKSVLLSTADPTTGAGEAHGFVS